MESIKLQEPLIKIYEHFIVFDQIITTLILLFVTFVGTNSFLLLFYNRLLFFIFRFFFVFNFFIFWFPFFNFLFSFFVLSFYLSFFIVRFRFLFSVFQFFDFRFSIFVFCFLFFVFRFSFFFTIFSFFTIFFLIVVLRQASSARRPSCKLAGPRFILFYFKYAPHRIPSMSSCAVQFTRQIDKKNDTGRLSSSRKRIFFCKCYKNLSKKPFHRSPK